MSKRDTLVDRLLADGSYADYFANKWSAILRNKRRTPADAHGTFAFHDWIRESLDRNLPYDQFVRSILTASGEISDNPAVAWYREVKDVEQEVEDSAQLFLGLRIQCARCHHHPFEKWSQRDYYGFAAFFSRVSRKPTAEPSELRVYHRRGLASSVNPKSGEQLAPTGLGSAPLQIAGRTRSAARPGGLDGRRQKPVLRPGAGEPLLEALFQPRHCRAGRRHAGHQSGHQSRVARRPGPAFRFQRLRLEGPGADDLSSRRRISSLPSRTSYNANDKQNFSRFYPRRLPAEVLLDAIRFGQRHHRRNSAACRPARMPCNCPTAEWEVIS